VAKETINLLRAKVGHKRHWPKINSFLYKVFYVDFPVTQASYSPLPKLLSIDKINVFSLYTRDHGNKSADKDWHSFITDQLVNARVPVHSNYRYRLISHPRLFGYAFNPISYWLVLDNKDALMAVLCEVRNTFKQSHNYLLYKSDHSAISKTDVLHAPKKLYVSPFTEYSGRYEFTFSYTKMMFRSTIEYHDDDQHHILSTYMGGQGALLSGSNILSSVALYPFMTILVVVRIQWQALKLYFLGVKSTTHQLPKKYSNNQTTRGSNKI
jgi:uncharacterized protein